ncbi:MAG: GTP cyclohydrolase I FolE [Rickettsiales bacterium]|nr:GTP cyclohydrolase I FolE [Rickettsiales bacterium]OUV52884.1 MAG: GTP cyclohydrolase I FolE [Rickettsiales bacterium TMED127]|tara:strand:+ start:26389 stop:26994 length:606 start_codon:yes stop_codon:yes gene_type:complete
MDATSPEAETNKKRAVSREQAEEAVKVLIRWAGDNPDREGLKETPKRVVNAYNEFFAGYKEDPKQLLNKTFDEVNGYNDIVMLKNISLHSHCEHHMVPIIGKVHLAYLPVDKVVGISKLARVVDIFAKRLQTQETMTQQIAEVIQKCLKPKGVAIYIEAFHQCMTTRGVSKPNVSTITSCFLGEFKNNDKMENKFLNFVKE